MCKLILWFVLLAAVTHSTAVPDTARLAKAPLPAAIREYLHAHGYREIPGTPGCDVFKGQFFRPGQTDLAVSCVNDSSAHLLVFERGATAHVEEVVRESRPSGQPASEFFAKLPCAFTRASPKVVRYFYDAWTKDTDVSDEARSISPVNHDGIEQSEAECCSVIHYWHDGRWWEITGME